MVCGPTAAHALFDKPGHKVFLSVSPASSRGLALWRDSVQTGAIYPKSLSGDHRAESVRFEY